MSAAAEEAHKVGRKMAAHAHGSTGILTAVQAGADSIEHGSLLCESPEAIRLMAERGVFLVPTLATVAMTTHGVEIPSFMAENDRLLGDAPQRSVRAALAAGVPIAMGTDAGVSNADSCPTSSVARANGSVNQSVRTLRVPPVTRSS